MQSFINSMTAEEKTGGAGMAGMTQVAFEEKLDNMESQMTQNKHFGEAMDSVSSVVANTQRVTKLRKLCKYLRVKAVRSTVNDKITELSKKSREDAFMKKNGLTRETALGFQKMMKDGVLERENVRARMAANDAQIAKLKALNVKLEEKFAEKWSFVEDFRKFSQGVLNENEDAWFGERAYLDDTVGDDEFDNSFDNYAQDKEAAISAAQRAYCMQPAVVTTVTTYMAQFNTRQVETISREFEEALREGGLSFLAQPLISGSGEEEPEGDQGGQAGGDGGGHADNGGGGATSTGV